MRYEAGRHNPTLGVVNFTQPGAVQNTWYTVLDDSNIDVYGIGFGITVANETVALRVTVDGNVFIDAGGAVLLFAGNAWANLLSTLVVTSGVPVLNYSASGAICYICNTQGWPMWLRGRTVRIEIRKTTNGGASALRCILVYGKQ